MHTIKPKPMPLYDHYAPRQFDFLFHKPLSFAYTTKTKQQQTTRKQQHILQQETI
jgi:hypothetical protein